MLQISLLCGLLHTAGIAGANETPALTPEQVAWIGDRIYANECNRQPACLTAWNTGEAFPSLGIGHFIWYRAGQQEIYEESFPALLAFMQARGITLPAWLGEQGFNAPWPTREAFLADRDSPRVSALRTFLGSHTAEQTAFIIHRFDAALAAILDSVTEQDGPGARETIAHNFYAVANSTSPHGLYALIDYVNFKGTGIAASERYQGEGWGLKQVLLGMKPETEALPAFVSSARSRLALRVSNAPADRNEGRWLPGWENRLATYLPQQD